MTVTPAASPTVPAQAGAILIGLLCLLLASNVHAGPAAAPTPFVSGSGASALREQIDRKLSGLQERIQVWLATGGDPGQVLPLGQKLDELLAQGRLEEADAQIDRIRALVGTVPSPPPRAAAAGEPAATPRSVDARPIPPDAALIFYSTRSGLGPEIYTMNSDGGDVTQITFLSPRPVDQPYEHVALSFDHKVIAANRYLKSGTGPTGLWVIDLEHHSERRLVADFFTAGNGGVDWSADGFIYFAGQRTPGEKQGIFRIRVDGSQLTQVRALDAADPGFVGDVSVSEDSSLVAYVRAVPMYVGSRKVLKTQIWVIRPDGNGDRMVDDGGPELGNQGGFPIGDFDPEISPDNKYVVFSRTNTQHVSFKDSFNNGQDLWVAALDGSQPARRLTPPGPISIVPDWHDGKIVFTQYDEAGSFAGLAMINADGTGYRRLEPSLRTLRECGRHAKWVPGARLAAPP